MGVLDLVADRYFGPLYTKDPAGWNEDILNGFLWSGQREVARSLVENRYTAVRACHDVGKSRVAAVLCNWWIDVHPPGEAFVVTTAPTAAQVSSILWREIGKIHTGTAGRMRGRINASGYPKWMIGNELVGYGRKPADYDQSAFQGIHARYVLVIIDEADGVPRSLYDGVDALATNENSRVLAIGNPDNPSSHFATVCRPDSGWNVLELDGLRSPNFTEAEVNKHPQLRQFMDDHGIQPTTEPVPDYLRDLLVSPVWVAERMRRWGVNRRADGTWETSALWESKVRGRFPTSSNEGVIPMSWVQDAMTRWKEVNDRSQFDPDQVMLGPLVYGLDVARTGGDETVLAKRRGEYVYEISPLGASDTMTTVNRVVSKLDHPQTKIGVDVIGVGAGVVDRLRELEKNVVAFNASAGSKQTDITGEFRFTNARAAAWWGLRERLDPSQPGGSNVMLPPSDTLMADLTAPKWRVKPGAKIQIEDKDEIRKRLGRSPDYGDAVVIAFSVNGEVAGDPVYSGWTNSGDLDDGLSAEWI